MSTLALPFKKTESSSRWNKRILVSNAKIYESIKPTDKINILSNSEYSPTAIWQCVNYVTLI